MVMIVKDDVFLNLIGRPVTPPTSGFLLRCTSRQPRWPSPSASAPPSLWACSTCRRSTSSSSTPSRTSPNANAASRPLSPPPPWPASCRSWRPSGPTARWRRSCARAWRPAVSSYPPPFNRSEIRAHYIIYYIAYILYTAWLLLHHTFCQVNGAFPYTSGSAPLGTSARRGRDLHHHDNRATWSMVGL